MVTEAEKLGEKRAWSYLNRVHYSLYRSQLQDLDNELSSANAEKHAAVIGVAAGLAYLATRDLGAAVAVTGFLSGVDVLAKIPAAYKRKEVMRRMPIQAEMIGQTERELAGLELNLSSGGLMNEEVTSRLAALKQIESAGAQEAAEKKAREEELSKCESKFDEVIATNASGNSSWNLDKFTFGATTRNEWTALLRAKGNSETEIVRHQLGRYKQLEAANKVPRDMKAITVMVDSLQAQLHALELVDSNRKTSV